MIAARPLRFRNGRGAACGAASLIPRRSGESRGPREIRGGLLTKMSRRGDSETQRRFRGAISAGGGSLEFSLFTRRGGRRKTAPATAPQLRTYKTAPAPPGPRASVNISARDFWAEKGWLPKRNSIRTHRQGPPEIWFRIQHVAPDDLNAISGTELHEQFVEIALGPKGAFENGSIGTLKRRVAADRVVNTAMKARRPAKPPKQPQTPRVVELLRKAQEWRRQLDVGEVPTQAEIARREGLTRARVTQVMSLLRLAPEIQEHLMSLPAVVGRGVVSERALRRVVLLDNSDEQIAQLRSILG